jgi:hypothetical protein
MAGLTQFALLVAALVGQFAITVWLFNRLHAVAMPRPLLKWLEKLILLASATLAVVVALRWLTQGQSLRCG